MFDGLSSLELLYMEDNSLAALPEDVFDGLDNLTNLLVSGNAMETLPSDVFDGLSDLQVLFIQDNPLIWLPPDVFDGLSSLQELRMHSDDTDFTPAQSLACIHASQFDGLSELQELRLGLHELGSINPAHFIRWSLGKLTELRLGPTLIGSSPLDFAATYQPVLPALTAENTWVENTATLTDPICQSLERLSDCGSGPLNGRTK